MFRGHRRNNARDRTFLKLFVAERTDVTPDEIDYFRDHPDEIDEITAPIMVHRTFLAFGVILGVLLVGGSKLLKYNSTFQFFGVYYQEFAVDIVFEIGVALVGAGVTSYLLGILLNVQQDNAAKWRQNIRKEIEKSEGDPNTP